MLNRNPRRLKLSGDFQCKSKCSVLINSPDSLGTELAKERHINSHKALIVGRIKMSSKAQCNAKIVRYYCVLVGRELKRNRKEEEKCGFTL
jgi:hypothetical protein